MSPSQCFTQSTAASVPFFMGLVFLFSAVVADAQSPEDGSVNDADQAASLAQAQTEYLDGVIEQEDVEGLRRISVWAIQAQDWAMAGKAAFEYRRLTDNWDLVALELSGLVESGDNESALETLLASVGEPAGEWTGWEGLHPLLWAIPDPTKALALLRELEASAPPPQALPSILDADARLQYKAGQTQRALELTTTLIDGFATAERVLWGVRLAKALDEPKLGLEFLDRLSAAEQSNTEFSIWRAQLLSDLGRFEEAIAALETADPSPEVLYYLAEMAIGLDRTELANRAWDSLDLADNAATVSAKDAYYAAHLAQLLGHFGQAWKWFGRVDEPPWVYESLLARGLLLNRLAESQGFDRLSGSLAEVQAGLARVREESQGEQVQQAWAIEAMLLRQAGQSKALLEVLGVALSTSPDDVDLLYLRALEAMHVGDLELAEQDLRRMIRIDADQADALNALGYMLADQTTRYGEAYRLIERALELQPASPEILDSMGWVNYRLGRLPQAVEYLEKAYALLQDPEIKGHLIAALEASGEVERLEELGHTKATSIDAR